MPGKQRRRPLVVSLPESIDFGFVTVKVPFAHPFTIDNPNDCPVPFHFKADRFTATPSSGIIAPKSKLACSVGYLAQQAIVEVGTLVLEVEEEEPRLFKFSVIGKWAYLSLSTEKLAFDHILVGRSISKELLIKNNGLVAARFRIESEKEDELRDNSFSVDIHEGEIPPKKSFLVQVTFRPSLVRLICYHKFIVSSEGGNSCAFECMGEGAGFQLRLSQNSINFGEIKLDTSTSRLLTLHNESELPTSYQFNADVSNVFSFSEPRGTVPGKSYKRITVEFTPRNTISYYERVFLQVHHGMSLLYVDLLGTCFDLLIKPIPVMQCHVDSFRRRVAEGRISEIDLRYIENSLLLKFQHAESEDREQSAVKLAVDQIEKQVALYKECFQDVRSRDKLLSLSDEVLNFGYCEPMTLSPGQEITVRNNLACKLQLFWISQRREGLSGEQMTVFQVYPQTASVKANSEAKFTVTFRPLQSGNYYFQHLQFFAIRYNSKLSKEMIEQFQRKQHKLNAEISVTRNIKLTQTLNLKVQNEVAAAQMIPPFAGSIHLVGHSFRETTMAFIPMVETLPSSRVSFVPCSPGQSRYQSILLVNKSDTHSYFNILPDAAGVFRSYPARGLIESKRFALIHLEFCPQHPGLHNSTLVVQLNFSQGQHKLSLSGLCSEPSLQLENQGRLFFPPSYLGVLSKHKIAIRNASRLQISCETTIPDKYKDQIHTDPRYKVLQPRETTYIEVSFAPYHKKKYKLKLPLLVEEVIQKDQELAGYWKPGSLALKPKESLRKEYSIEIIGAGGDGCLALQPEGVNFNVVKVSEHDKKTVKLKNLSEANFYVELQLVSKKGTTSQNNIQKAFSLDFTEGLIAAKSEILVGIIFTPFEVCSYDIELLVNSKEKNPKGKKNRPGFSALGMFKCGMSVKATGSYPTLKIVDIRNDSVSVAALWENFQISKINKELSEPLNQHEQKYLNIETLPFQEAQELQSKLRCFSWNYGYVPAKNMKARKIIVTVQNCGGTPLDYTFKFPSDNKIEEETWADPGEPNEEEAYEKAILAKNIFQIRPRSDSLDIGAIRDIELIYTPANISKEESALKKRKESNNEKHRLKVVFQITNGKPLVINLTGMTLGTSEGLVVVKKNHYELTPAPIGLLVPIKFPIEIQNVGSGKVNFEVKIAGEPSQKDLSVFSIKNASGSLPPGQKQYLYCLFRPLESRLYNFELKISVFDFVKQAQEVNLTVEGQGYHRIGKTLSAKPQRALESEIPGQRSLVSEIGSKVFFSMEEIDFGVLLPGQFTHRMIILYNLSKTSGFFFDFNSSSSSLNNKNGLACGDLFQIEPSCGEVEAECWIELKLSLCAAKTPSIFEGEIECSICWGKKEEDREKEKIGQSTTPFEKETLFLRIKKSCSLDLKEINEKRDPEFRNYTGDDKRSLIDCLRQNILLELINEREVVRDIQRRDAAPFRLIADLDEEQPACYGLAHPETALGVPVARRNFKNHKYMFLCDQFLELVDMIMENTFFNIIQETTRKENDLLRVAKRFIPVSRP